MRAGRFIVGRMARGDTPDWRPLARIMSHELMCSFMWMYEVETLDGGCFHAYKHIETRRYVHVDLQGNAFAYVGEERYRCVPLADVLEEALKSWWEVLRAEPEEEAAAWAAIAAARRI